MPLFPLLFLLYAILCEAKRIHKCSHNDVYPHIDLHEVMVNYDHHPYDNALQKPRRLSTTTEPAPIRIKPYYDPTTVSTDNDLTLDQISYIKSVISTATRFYSQFVQVIPVQNNLSFDRVCTKSYDTEFGTNCVEYETPSECGMVEIPSHHLSENILYFYDESAENPNTTAAKLPAGIGIPDTDVVIYVSYGKSGSCQSSTLAWAAPCLQDQFGRPIAGTINVCPHMFKDTHYWKQDVVTLVHEMTHVVIMGPPLWHHFRDPITRLAIPYDEVVSDEQRDNLTYIISPKVRAFARKHFGCDSLIGWPLEDTGSGGSAGAHWDEHYTMSALMGSTIWGGLQYFTDLSFSLMEDSGWYYVNYSYSEPFYYGKDAGCDFFDEECIDWTTGESNFPQFFCESKSDNGCFYNYEAPGECEFYYHNEDLPWFLQYFTDSSHGG
eukprot:446870_1